MAIYYLSMKSVSRGAGRSATAAAAYQAASRLADRYTGQVFNHTRKSGVEHVEIVLPAEATQRDINWPHDREQLWNAAEAAEKRKNARVAREYQVALPHELSREQRLALVREFSRDLANRYGVAVDFAIHQPHRQGDARNHHAHLLTTTRQIEATGLGAKAVIEWNGRDRAKWGLGPGKEELAAIRERWATLTNESLRAAGLENRVDHRSLKAQGIDREPTTHLGPAVTGMHRRGIETEVGRRIEAEAQARLERAAELGRLEHAAAAIERSIRVIEAEPHRARQEREALQLAAAPERSRPYDPEEARRVAREKWLEYRDRQAREERGAGQERGAASERTATYDREAAQRAAIERWLEYRERHAGKGNGIAQSQSQEQEESAQRAPGRGQGRDTPDDDFSL